MAEGRMLKKAISTSRRLADLQTDSSRMLYTWIIPHLDVEGRFYADPEMVKGSVVPRIREFTLSKIKECLADMNRVGLIQIYMVDGDAYLQLRKFENHQNLRRDKEAKSTIPPPIKEEDSRTTPVQLPEDSRTTPDQIQSTPTEEKLREEKLREVNARAREEDLLVDNSPSNTHGERWTQTQLDELETLVEETKTRYGAKYHQQVYVWVQTYFNRANPDAVLYCLRRLIQERLAGKQIPAPGRWLEAVIAVENAKHEARLSEQEHQARKAEESRDVAKLISGIGRGA